jgi:hypothetical protein
VQPTTMITTPSLDLQEKEQEQEFELDIRVSSPETVSSATCHVSYSSSKVCCI